MKYIYIALILVLFCELGYGQLTLSPYVGVQFVDINQKGFVFEGSVLTESDAIFPLKISANPFSAKQFIFGAILNFAINKKYSLSLKFNIGETLKQKTTYAGSDFIYHDIYRIKFRTYEFNSFINRKIYDHFKVGLGINYINYKNIIQVLKNDANTVWELKHDNEQIGLTAVLTYEFKNVEFLFSYGKGLLFLGKKFPRQFNPINSISLTVGYKFVPKIVKK